MNYQIYGEPMPVVVCNVEPGETLVCESGAMSWMSPNMQMKTVGGGAGKVLGRMFSGENAFQNHYTAEGGPGMIAFASSFPGSIRAVQITPDHPVICQKKAYLASTAGVELSVHFQKKLGTGFFGGEGFVMQKLSGNGLAFLEIDGSTMEYNLAPGQQMVLDTGYLAMMDATVQMDVQTVKGVKNVLLGGEGFFNTVVTGPGKVVLQTMPISGFVGLISGLLPKK
ncbi:MAG: TIGR00266 family protein [Oscillospiraceae bacterium]|nr:TIGR00266 family protein [Oscillospiraceae bacterium]